MKRMHPLIYLFLPYFRVTPLCGKNKQLIYVRFRIRLRKFCNKRFSNKQKHEIIIIYIEKEKFETSHCPIFLLLAHEENCVTY